MLIAKQTLKIFIVQLIVFAGLLSIGVGSKYTLDYLETDSKAHLQALLDAKKEAGYEAYQSLQMVMEENPDLIMDIGKAKNKSAIAVAASSLFLAVMLLYLSAVFMNAFINKKT